MEIFSFLIKTTTMRTTNVAANCPDSLWLVEGVTSLPSITLLKMQSQVPIFGTKWFNMNQYSVVPILLGHYALKFCVWCPCKIFCCKNLQNSLRVNSVQFMFLSGQSCQCDDETNFLHHILMKIPWNKQLSPSGILKGKTSKECDSLQEKRPARIK